MKLKLLIIFLVLVLLYSLRPILPIKGFEENKGFILGNIPQSTTLADFEITKGQINFKDEIVGKGQKLVFTENTKTLLSEKYTSKCYDCLISDRILKGKVTKKIALESEVLYEFEIEKHYFTSYIPLLFSEKIGIVDVLILIFILIIVLKLVPRIFKNEKINN